MSHHIVIHSRTQAYDSVLAAQLQQRVRNMLFFNFCWGLITCCIFWLTWKKVVPKPVGFIFKYMYLGLGETGQKHTLQKSSLNLGVWALTGSRTLTKPTRPKEKRNPDGSETLTSFWGLLRDLQPPLYTIFINWQVHSVRL